MSKHSNQEYVRKPLGGGVIVKGAILLIVGVILVVIGFGGGSTYVGPIGDLEKFELQKVEYIAKKKEVLSNKLMMNKSEEETHGVKEKPAESEHKKDDHAKDSHAADGHGPHSSEPTINTRLWANFLVMFLFVLSIGAGSLFLVGLDYLVGANWSTPLKRITEILCFMIFPAFILGLVIYLGGMDSIYSSWVNMDKSDKILVGKEKYLDKNWFLIRFVMVYIFWGIFYFFFINNSKKQDESKDQKYTALSGKFAPIFMIGFSFAITIVAIDWIMTLSPKWFSTMFGVAYFGGAVTAALAAIVYATVKMKENGYLHPKMKNDTFYSLAGLLFGFNCFWAYVSFCQFMLIWYSNIPEETFWYIYRWDGAWLWYTLCMIVFHFVIPFFALISRSSKTNLARLKVMAVWLLVAHYVDLYWQVTPTFSNSPFIGAIEIGFLLISLGLLVVVFAVRAKNVNHVAIGDPRLEQGLGFRLH